MALPSGAPALHCPLKNSRLVREGASCNASVELRSRCFKTMEIEMYHGRMQVIYRQIAAWVVHGVLWDPHGEFFIQPVRRSSVGQEEGRSPGPDFASHRVSVKVGMRCE